MIAFTDGYGIGAMLMLVLVSDTYLNTKRNSR